MKVTESEKTKNELIRNEIRIYNVAPHIHQQLINIAANQGIKWGDFLKLELRKVIDRYPEKDRLPFKPDSLDQDQQQAV